MMTMMMTTTPMTTPRRPTTKNDRRTDSNSIQRNPAFPHLSYRGIVLLGALLASHAFISPVPTFAFGVPGSAAPTQHKPSPDDCIFYATVFTNEGRLLVGAEIHVRPSGKKKPDYEAWSDRRGEFAVRVPQGIDYDIEVKAKGFISQVRKSHAETGHQDMVFHMELQPEKKK
jgi:hypothetical protein